MRIVKSSFVLLWMVSLSAFASTSQEVMRFNRSVAGFVDFSSPGRLLLISEDGQANWVEDLKIQKSLTYQITAPECVPRTQSTMVMGDGVSGQGLTLAYPFLVGVERVCYIDEAAQTIRLLANLRPELPRDTFLAVHAGSDAEASYFLINGRIYPKGTSGYLLLLTIDKRTLQTSLRELVTGVPGLSGAMFFSEDALWVTSWEGTNDIHKIPVQKLHDLIHSGEKQVFGALASTEWSGIDGFSFFMLANEHSFFYHNEGYESYLVNRQDGTRSMELPLCPPIAGYGQGWLVLCDGTRIEKWQDESRAPR